MKQISILGAMALMLSTMASCSNENEPQNPAGEFRQVIVNASTEATQSRAASADVARYAISVWEDSEYSNPANIFSGNTNLATSEDGNFTLTLNTKKEYYCLFWADNGSDYTLGTTLKDVTVATDKNVTEAFSGTLHLEQGRNASYSVTLKRAVAHFSLLETGEIPAGYQMSFSWELPNTFNVATGSPEGENVASSVSWTSTAISGTSEAPAVLNDGIYVLASSTKGLHTFTYKCNDEEPVVLTNVPVAANYKTNIKGHFTTTEFVNFTITHNPTWESADENKEF